jgi:hypothetical protein
MGCACMATLCVSSAVPFWPICGVTIGCAGHLESPAGDMHSATRNRCVVCSQAMQIHKKIGVRDELHAELSPAQDGHLHAAEER